MIRPQDVTCLVRDHDHDAALASFLETDDFAAQHPRMLAHGVVFPEEPPHEPHGSVTVFEDPYGAPWDLIQPPVGRPAAARPPRCRVAFTRRPYRRRP